MKLFGGKDSSTGRVINAIVAGRLSMKRAVFYQILLAAVACALFGIWGCDSDENVGGLSVNGRIGVYPKPSFQEFPWEIAGPGGFSLADTGNVILEDMVPGTYTVTWGDLNGWMTSSDNPIHSELNAGSFLTMTTTYAEIGGERPRPLRPTRAK